MIQDEVLVARHSIPDHHRVWLSTVTWDTNALMSKIVHKTMNGKNVNTPVENGCVSLFYFFRRVLKNH
ncbi:MAG: hypothetical protein BAJATHORv1_30398 [Candidatus Thorarchaeota archaeon]|nr:MAG: hypothetical protein BAJATHORv1_30398 [Candidatus Thorarchaeota archaeon]